MGRQRADVAPTQDGWDRRRRILLSEYERVALELFAERGYHEVTVDDIAAAVGVTTRTLFRYFGSKQDCLLGFPRRGLAAELEMIESLEPSGDPLAAAWAGIHEFVTENPVETEVLRLWEAATARAPEVVIRVRGERIDAIYRAFLEYAARSLGVDPDRDPEPRLLAGILAGVELTLVESIAQVPALSDDLADLTDAAVRKLGAARTGRR